MVTARRTILVAAALVLGLGAPSGVRAQSEEKMHLLVLGASDFFAHDAVSHAMFTMAKIGERSGLFDVRFRTDMELVSKAKLKGNRKNLDYFDAVMFYTQGDLEIGEAQKADLMRFVKEDGKGILVAHSGTDSFRETWPEYIEMVGGGVREPSMAPGDPRPCRGRLPSDQPGTSQGPLCSLTRSIR